MDKDYIREIVIRVAGLPEDSKAWEFIDLAIEEIIRVYGGEIVDDSD